MTVTIDLSHMTTATLVRVRAATQRMAHANEGSLTGQVANELVEEINEALDVRALDRYEASADHDCLPDWRLDA